MENAHSAFFVVVMYPKEAAGDRTCESADQAVFWFMGSCYSPMRCVTIKKVLSSSIIHDNYRSLTRRINFHVQGS